MIHGTITCVLKLDKPSRVYQRKKGRCFFVQHLVVYSPNPKNRYSVDVLQHQATSKTVSRNLHLENFYLFFCFEQVLSALISTVLISTRLYNVIVPFNGDCVLDCPSQHFSIYVVIWVAYWKLDSCKNLCDGLRVCAPFCCCILVLFSSSEIIAHCFNRKILLYKMRKAFARLKCYQSVLHCWW